MAPGEVGQMSVRSKSTGTNETNETLSQLHRSRITKRAVHLGERHDQSAPVLDRSSVHTAVHLVVVERHATLQKRMFLDLL